MFTRIEFDGFRGFQHLELDGLKRVNLIVGRNNSGKTSLLEGLALAANPKGINELPKLLRFQMGPNAEEYVRWIVFDGQREGRIAAINGDLSQDVTFKAIRENPPGSAKRLVSEMSASPNYKAEKFASISVTQTDPHEVVQSFAKAVKQRKGEETLEKLLHDVDPRISKIRIDPSSGQNVIVVDVGLSEMIALSQAGQGIYRLVAIFSELIGEKPAICFIDEIENGIHHSALGDVWKGLAEAAELLDIQIFATTHSYECIEAAHAAFAARSSYDFSIIQLFRVEKGIQGRVLDRRLIEAALAGDIDLRGA